jgi:hypothetical protein
MPNAKTRLAHREKHGRGWPVLAVCTLKSVRRGQSDGSTGSKAAKLREQLGWEAGILNSNGGKPKGMHCATFERLEAQHDALVNQTLAGILSKFRILDPGMPDLAADPHRCKTEGLHTGTVRGQ